MNELAEKVRAVEREISREKGPFTLFALLETDFHDHWDILVSAPWLKQYGESFTYLLDVLKRHLGNDFVRLSRVVVRDKADPPVRTLTEKFDIEHGGEELLFPERFDLPDHVKFGYIITARKAA